MAEAGILREYDLLELLDGDIVEWPPIVPRHLGAVTRAIARFYDRFRDVAVILAQNLVRLGEFAEPQPDLAPLRPRTDFYSSALLSADDTLLVVECADTSVGIDRHVKIPLYARTGIPEAWLLDLNQETITIYRDPAATGYRSVRVVRRGESLAPLALPDRHLSVDELFG